MIDEELSKLKNSIPNFNIDDYKDEIYNKRNRKTSKNRYFFKITFSTLIIAMLLCVIGLTAHSLSVEAKEYQAAVEFFETNKLSTDGLTRTEVKEIYRDITTNKFQYKKTGEVIVKSIKNKVPGYSIELKDADSSTIANCWELWDKLYKQLEASEIGIHYEHALIPEIDHNGVCNFRMSKFTKYENAVMCWQIELFYLVEGYCVSDDYLIVYGCQLSSYASEYTRKVYMTKISNDGEIIWEQGFDDSSDFYRVIINEDDTITAFSNKTYQNSYLKMYNLNSDGTVIYSNQNSFDNLSIRNIVKINDGYLIHLVDNNYSARFSKIDMNGDLQKEFSYDDENYKYIFTDAIEFEGKLYLSAYSVSNFDKTSTRGELGKILDRINEMKNDEITDEFVLNLFKEEYKAVLFVCDKEDGELTKFYTADAALGSSIKVEDGMLIWEVEYLSNMFYSPATSSFTFGGVTQVYNYIYNKNGEFLNADKTETLRVFRR